MHTTTIDKLTPTATLDGQLDFLQKNELCEVYDELLQQKKLTWTNHLHLKKRLGSGGQGVVYYSERKGADDFTLPVAIKIFSPERFETEADYGAAMKRIARITGSVARIQHDNLIDVQNFIEKNEIRMLVMEWIDGIDLRKLLNPEILLKTKHRVSAKRWEYINRVIATRGPSQNHIKPGVAVAIVRECLAALAALHRDEIIHGDIKPANIMLKRTGTVKIIDIGSAYELSDPPRFRACTPTYAALEIMEGKATTPRSDLASLGYVLIELLAGQPAVPHRATFQELVEAKRSLPNRLDQLLPEDIMRNELLVNFCRRLISPDPEMRFPTAEDADLKQDGAAAFLRQLVKGDLSSEYDNEIRVWLDELCEMWEEDLEGGF
ncbi:MAG: serine/threonine-protein kinase [Planctomycetota bacterium]|nr:serine/threonine-protein kinase [Planctomycetota bacterium]